MYNGHRQAWDLCSFSSTNWIAVTFNNNSPRYIQWSTWWTGYYTTIGSSWTVLRLCNSSSGKALLYSEITGENSWNGRYRLLQASNTTLDTTDLGYSWINKIVKLSDNKIAAIDGALFSEVITTTTTIASISELDKYFYWNSTTLNATWPKFDTNRQCLISNDTASIYNSIVWSFAIWIAKETVTSWEDIITTVRWWIAKWSSLTADDIWKPIRMSSNWYLSKTWTSSIVWEAVDVWEFYFTGKEIV